MRPMNVRRLDMATNPIQMDPNVRYPEKWTFMEFVCKCGMKCRVDIEVIPGFRQGGEFFRHCSQDEDHFLPGPVIQIWEEKR